MAVKKVNLMIAGKKIPVKISEEEEKVVREVENNINKKIQEYNRKYQSYMIEDILVMLLLESSLDLYNERNSDQESKLISKLTELENLLQ